MVYFDHWLFPVVCSVWPLLWRRQNDLWEGLWQHPADLRWPPVQEDGAHAEACQEEIQRWTSGSATLQCVEMYYFSPPPPPPHFFFFLKLYFPPFPLLQGKVLQRKRDFYCCCCGGCSTFILACIGGAGEATMSLKLRFCWTCTGKCSEAQSACVVSTRKGSVDITRHKGRLTRFSAEDGEANFSPCVTHIGSVDQCLTRFSADGGEANSSPCVCCQGISFWLGFWLRMEGSPRPTLALVCVARGSVSRSTWLSGSSWRASMMWTQPSASTTWPVSPSTEVGHLSVVSSSLVSATRWPFHQCINRAHHTVWCMLHNICMVTH